jgi:disulfide bond formation protein DsbB
VRGFGGLRRKNGGMDRDAVQIFSAVLALTTFVGGLGTLVALAADGRASWATSWLTQIRETGLWLMCAVTGGAMVGSLYFSEVANYAPCKLCWYQRIAMYSIAIITFVAALRRDRKIAPYTIVLAAVGLVVSTYHYVLEWFPTLETSVCSLDTPCTTIWFREFGFVTLCFMAGSAFIFVISTSLALIRNSSTPAE